MDAAPREEDIVNATQLTATQVTRIGDGTRATCLLSVDGSSSMNKSRALPCVCRVRCSCKAILSTNVLAEHSQSFTSLRPQIATGGARARIS